MLKEFRDFAMRGNVVDMAIGIILGVAFGKIVSSLVADIIMPPIGVLMGGVDFSDYYINLTGAAYESLAAAKEAGAATINIGVFFNTVIDFVIVAFAIFIVIKQMNRLKKAPLPTDPTTRDCPRCLSSIPIMATKCAHCTADI